jgi:putative redox protein
MYAERKQWQDLQLSIRLELELRKDRHLIRRQVAVAGAPDEEAMARLRDIVERTPVTLALKAGFDIDTDLAAGAVSRV